ncbi:nuclear transport factor 2 family protein [Agromyces mangrovi Wang et al. 2018]|uniref:nuclear transport factor 2 family protein n=1 Tax=Agromyces mangrovi TaxID=1858653 RepID=UPI00257337C5|nr:nuclear transport factor 2 family protein [Agromyces mangrovi]BDZ65268.1 hypothetical protein GCM10025877_22060 [Agromyces mangrovi]
MDDSSTQVLLRFYDAIASGASGDALRPHLADDAVVAEHPNAIAPTGAVRGMEEMLEASARGAGLLAWQRYDVRDIEAHGDRVIARLTWSAEVLHDAGPLAAGQVLRAHIAQFARVADGRISELETYDCYEPFGG